MIKLYCGFSPHQLSFLNLPKASNQLACNWTKDNLVESYDWFSLGKYIYIWNGIYYEKLINNKPIINAIISAWSNIGRTYSINHKKEIISLLKDETMIDGKLINNLKGEYIPFQNGYFSIENNKFLPLKNTFTNNLNDEDLYKSDLFKDLYCMYAIPHRHNNKATCEPFKKVLDKIFTENGKLNVRNRDLFMIYFAYCLTDNINLQKMLILYGLGSNGKSFLANIMQAVLGSDLTCHIELQEASDRFTKIHFMGKLLNIADDIPPTALTSKVESILKILSGTKYMKGAYKGVDEITFKITCKHVTTCNCIPNTPPNADFAFFRRWIVLPLLYTFKDEEIDIQSMLEIFTEESIEGIIQYVLSYLPRLDELQSYTAEEAKASWHRYGDSISSFMYFHINEHGDHAMPVSEVYQIYVKYCQHNNLKIFNNIQFGKMTSKKGISKNRQRASLFNPKTKQFEGLSNNPIYHCVNFEMHFTEDEAENLGIIRTNRNTWRIKAEDEVWYYSDDITQGKPIKKFDMESFKKNDDPDDYSNYDC